jgi:hypothetical protein
MEHELKLRSFYGGSGLRSIGFVGMALHSHRED